MIKAHSLKASIKKIHFKVRDYGSKCYTEISYTVEGSEKIHKHTIYHHGGSSKIDSIYWRNDEILHFMKQIDHLLKSKGNMDRTKTLYEGNIDFGISMYNLHSLNLWRWVEH